MYQIKVGKNKVGEDYVDKTQYFTENEEMAHEIYNNIINHYNENYTCSDIISNDYCNGFRTYSCTIKSGKMTCENSVLFIFVLKVYCTPTSDIDVNELP